MTALDPTGGLTPDLDEVTSGTPDLPTYREGTSLWLWDDAGRFGFPRIGVEAVGATWETSRGIHLNMAFPDGRVRLGWGDHRAHPAADADGRPRVLGAGPVRFVCVEPFAHWQLEFDGQVAVTSAHDQVRGRYVRGGPPGQAPTAALRVEVDVRMAAPPWVQGSYEPEGAFIPGENRFEQLCTATGTVTLDGTATSFTGGGLRIHRKGGNRSDYGQFFGHCWQSALFPSGRAFGFLHYRPGPGRPVVYHEGWVFDGRTILPARVADTPWLDGMRPGGGEDVSVTLRTAAGDIRIEGDVFASSFTPERPIDATRTFPDLQQGIAAYRWGGETAYGMIERSTRRF